MKSLSCVWLFVTPWTVAHQAPPSMEFSRQEYWSGLPFPSPGDLPDPGIDPKSPALQVDSLTAEPQEKPKNTGVDSLSILQRIFLTQELNWGLLHCRRILYQLSYQGFSLFSVLESEKKILKSIKREASKICNFYKSLIDPWLRMEAKSLH